MRVLTPEEIAIVQRCAAIAKEASVEFYEQTGGSYVAEIVAERIHKEFGY